MLSFLLTAETENTQKRKLETKNERIEQKVTASDYGERNKFS